MKQTLITDFCDIECLQDPSINFPPTPNTTASSQPNEPAVAQTPPALPHIVPTSHITTPSSTPISIEEMQRVVAHLELIGSHLQCVRDILSGDSREAQQTRQEHISSCVRGAPKDPGGSSPWRGLSTRRWGGVGIDDFVCSTCSGGNADQSIEEGDDETVQRAGHREDRDGKGKAKARTMSPGSEDGRKGDVHHEKPGWIRDILKQRADRQRRRRAASGTIELEVGESSYTRRSSRRPRYRQESPPRLWAGPVPFRPATRNPSRFGAQLRTMRLLVSRICIDGSQNFM